MFGYREIIQEVFWAHKEFQNEWKDWRNGKRKKSKKVRGDVEPESVTNARNNFFQKLDALYASKIEPLERKFKENPHSALAESLEFLSVDIPAFRCGYAKEFFLKWLKQADFSLGETEKIKNLVIEVCETESFRREFRRWGRLAVKIADADFVLNLQKLTESENKFARIKSRWILEAIRQNRLDLRNEIR